MDLGAGATPRYRLLYERTRAFIPFGVPWRSWIESRSSDDLRRWSDPVVLLRPTLPWHRDAKQGEAVSNPCLVRAARLPLAALLQRGPGACPGLRVQRA